MNTIVDISEAADAFLINQLFSISTGGGYWESGGQISTGGSSTAIEMSIGSVTVNIGGEVITHGSQPVTLSATSGEYRSDVIYADSAGIDKVEGVEMPKIPTDNDFPNVWQPAPDNGSLVPGVPLWVVHVTPNDAASVDIESWQWQDRRINAAVAHADVADQLERVGDWRITDNTLQVFPSADGQAAIDFAVDNDLKRVRFEPGNYGDITITGRGMVIGGTSRGWGGFPAEGMVRFAGGGATGVTIDAPYVMVHDCRIESDTVNAFAITPNADNFVAQRVYIGESGDNGVYADATGGEITGCRTQTGSIPNSDIRLASTSADIVAYGNVNVAIDDRATGNVVGLNT